MTERAKQEAAVKEHCRRLGGAQMAFRYVFRCEDGANFSAIAPSERHALMVLAAERPGMRATYLGAIGVARWEPKFFDGVFEGP